MMMISDEEKRWVVVGLAMNKVVVPPLRPFIKQGMDAHYNKLDTHCNGLSNSIHCSLKTLTHSQASTDAILKNLKFQNINNNLDLHGQNKKLYNCSVFSPVDLAKLYLPSHLAMFAAFDESLDMSAILRLLSSYSATSPIFPSPDPHLSIQTTADDVRDGVRNMWGHCDITHWTEAFFNDCFAKLEALVRSVGLAGDVEKTALDQLSDWKTKGRFFCMGHAVNEDLLSLVQQLVGDLRKELEKDRSAVRKSLAGQKRKFSEIQQAVSSLQDQQRSQESGVNEEENEVTRLQKEDATRILERLGSLEKKLAGEITNKIRRLEQETVQGNEKLQELEKRQVQTDGKVQQLENHIYLKTIPDAHHVDDFQLKVCRTKLAEHYKRTARVPTSVWSSKTHVTIHEIYTRLTWVRKRHTATGPSQTKLEHYTDVFKETQTGVFPKRILVQGNAGMGKSTFVKKLAVDWADLVTSDQHSEALRKFELVVVVRLREISHCQSVREVIRCSRILPNDDPALTNCLLNFVVNNQEKVLFVLDGYDEYGGGRESTILEIFQGDKLRDCCVLMTSRPSKAEDLQELADVHAEITGFCEEDIWKFMRRMLGDEKEANDLQSCLRKKEVLSTARTPLLLLFYCIMWKKGKEKSFCGTRTELYLSMVRCLLDHGHGRRRSTGSRRKLDDYKEILADLGKVALEALLKDDLVFEYDKLSEAVQCEASRIIGLLEVTEYTENVTPAGHVAFIHSTIQEFLAAWYITHRCVPAGNLGPVKRSAQTFEKCLVLENVLRFICGLSDDGAEKVFEHLKSVRISDPTVDLSKRIGFPDSEQQSRYEGTYKEERFNGFVYELFKEAHLKEKLLKYCFDCTEGIVLLSDLVCEYLGQLQHVTCVTDSGLFVLPRSRDVRKPQVFPDCLNVPLGFNANSGNLKLRDFLIEFQKVRCKWCFFRSILWLRENSMKFYMIDLRLSCDSHASLICETFAGRVSCVEFLREFECLVPLSEETMEQLGEIVGESKHLSRIELSGNDAICCFLNQLPNAAMRNCSLYFKWITLSSPGAEALSNLLPRFKNIAAIRFGLRGCSGASCRSLIAGITHETLKELSLWTAELNPETASALCASLSETSMLEELSLVGDDKVMENGETDFLFGELKTELPLRILEFSRYLVGNSIAALSCTFRFFPALQELYLHRVGICERDTRILVESFGNTPNLEVLSLSCNPLGRGVRHVVFALTILPKLRLLNLNQTDSSEEDMTYFREVVEALPVPSLEHLNLSCNPLGPGVRSVMKLITKLPKLRALYVRNTGCSAEDMSFLCEAVNIEPSLNVEYLYFSSNPIGKDVRFVISLISRLPKLCSLYLDDTGCSEEDVTRCIRETQRIPPSQSFRITGKMDSTPGDWLKGGVVIRI